MSVSAMIMLMFIMMLMLMMVLVFILAIMLMLYMLLTIMIFMFLTTVSNTTVIWVVIFKLQLQILKYFLMFFAVGLSSVLCRRTVLSSTVFYAKNTLKNY